MNDIPAILPPPTNKKPTEEVDAVGLLDAFNEVTNSLGELSDEDMKRVIRSALMLRGFTWEDLEP